MYNTKKMKHCTNYKAVEHDMVSSLRHTQHTNCKDCVYFSSRNCGMDVADSIEPVIDLFC